MGASSSDDTKALQQFAEDNKVPLVSYAATAPELSDVNEYQNFMRTIPPDDQLTKVCDVPKNLNPFLDSFWDNCNCIWLFKTHPDRIDTK